MCGYRSQLLTINNNYERLVQRTPSRRGGKEMNEAQYYASESTAMPTQEELQFLAAEGNALLFADWFKTL